MSRALPGEHYCVAHQGNHSHYAQKNCKVCQLQDFVQRMAQQDCGCRPCTGQCEIGAAALMREAAQELLDSLGVKR